MQSRLALHPDVVDSMLEDRVLMDASQRSPRATPPVAPMVLTTSGFVILPAASAAFAPTGAIDPIGGNGNFGLNLAAKFYMTGFGLSVMKIGNASGDAALGAVDQATLRTIDSTNAGVPTSLNPTGNVAQPPANPAGQSLPLNPGSGFLFIGQSQGSILPGGPTPGRTLPTLQPYAPLAPMSPITPNEPTQALPETPGEVETNPQDSGAGLAPGVRGLETSNPPEVANGLSMSPVEIGSRTFDPADSAAEPALLDLSSLELPLAPSDSTDFLDPIEPKPGDWPETEKAEPTDVSEFKAPIRGLLYFAGTTPIAQVVLPADAIADGETSPSL